MGNEKQENNEAAKKLDDAPVKMAERQFGSNIEELKKKSQEEAKEDARRNKVRLKTVFESPVLPVVGCIIFSFGILAFLGLKRIDLLKEVIESEKTQTEQSRPANGSTNKSSRTSKSSSSGNSSTSSSSSDDSSGSDEDSNTVSSGKQQAYEAMKKYLDSAVGTDGNKTNEAELYEEGADVLIQSHPDWEEYLQGYQDYLNYYSSGMISF